MSANASQTPKSDAANDSSTSINDVDSRLMGIKQAKRKAPEDRASEKEKRSQYSYQ
jgi:hypothetical protein